MINKTQTAVGEQLATDGWEYTGIDDDRAEYFTRKDVSLQVCPGIRVLFRVTSYIYGTPLSVVAVGGAFADLETLVARVTRAADALREAGL